MENYKELDVWKKAINLVKETYQISKSFPPEERYGLISQLQRAAVSVPANIAEGWGRGSPREYVKHLRISKGSLMELETHLIIAHSLNYISAKVIDKLQKDIEVIGKMINSLIKSIQSKEDYNLS